MLLVLCVTDVHGIPLRIDSSSLIGVRMYLRLEMTIEQLAAFENEGFSCS